MPHTHVHSVYPRCTGVCSLSQLVGDLGYLLVSTCPKVYSGDSSAGNKQVMSELSVQSSTSPASLPHLLILWVAIFAH